MLFTERDQQKQEIQSLIEQHGSERSALIPILIDIQHQHNAISEFAMQIVAEQLSIYPVDVYAVVSFYHFLSEKPQGKFTIRLCRTISCKLAGKDAIASQLVTELNIGFGETTPDGLFTLEWANCIGMCDQGPAMLVNDEYFTKMTPEKVNDILRLCRISIAGGK